MRVIFKGTKSKYHGVKIKITWDHKGIWDGIFYFTLSSIGKTSKETNYKLNKENDPLWWEYHTEQAIDNAIVNKTWTIYKE